MYSAWNGCSYSTVKSNNFLSETVIPVWPLKLSRWQSGRQHFVSSWEIHTDFIAHPSFSFMFLNDTLEGWRIHQTSFIMSWEPSWDCFHGISVWWAGRECGHTGYKWGNYIIQQMWQPGTTGFVGLTYFWCVSLITEVSMWRLNIHLILVNQIFGVQNGHMSEAHL